MKTVLGLESNETAEKHSANERSKTLEQWVMGRSAERLVVSQCIG